MGTRQTFVTHTHTMTKMSKPIVGVSLKVYMSPDKTREYAENLKEVYEAAKERDVDFFFAPDMVSLAVVRKQSLPGHVLLAAQDAFWEDSGAYTGTVSPKNLRAIGVDMVEVGHAEQRRIFGETDEIVAKKTTAIVRNGMIPLICIGELKKCPPAEAVTFCCNQIEAAVAGIQPSDDIVVAYEPVWAIGQAEPAAAEYVVEVAKGIRQFLDKRPGSGRIIYGGSAGPGILSKMYPAVDGLFLGRFGHNVQNVKAVINELPRAADR